MQLERKRAFMMLNSKHAILLVAVLAFAPALARAQENATRSTRTARDIARGLRAPGG